MDFNESVQETARREVLEETGLVLKEMSLFGIYSGPDKEKTFDNGDQVSPVQILFRCHDFDGELRGSEESFETAFFSLDALPDQLFTEHKLMISDLINGKEQPIIG